MELVGRVRTLAAFAAAVLVLDLVVLAGGDDLPGVSVGDDGLSAEAVDQAPEDGATAEPDAAGGDGGDGTTTGQGGDATAPAEGAGGADDGAEATPAPDEAALTPPANGTYTYAARGAYSLSAGGAEDRHELPATATGTVSSLEGGGWRLEVVAGDGFTDRLDFSPGGDGLRWDGWALDRTFAAGSSTTVYTCEGESPHYVPGAASRTARHGCTTDGLSSAGLVEHIGTESVTLGDGSTVEADRLLYAYDVEGAGTTASGVGFTVDGRGRLDLWLDPVTGMRVREQRTIMTTTTFDTGGSQEYVEDVEFVLEAATAS